MFTQKTPISGCSQNIIREWARPVLFIDFLKQYFQFNWFKTILTYEACPP